MHNGIFAIFRTSKGVIKIKLTHEKTPGTVGNFIGLAEGALKTMLMILEHLITMG